MIDLLCRYSIPAAYAVLPPAMQSPNATALLLAIALQESGATHRRQVRGPARGFFQFEVGGVAGVRRHEASKIPLKHALARLCYSPTLPTKDLQAVLEHNDVLAVAVARLLLWTLPHALPERTDAVEGWRQYLEAWRPGKPHQATWDDHYASAWTLAGDEPS